MKLFKKKEKKSVNIDNRTDAEKILGVKTKLEIKKMGIDNISKTEYAFYKLGFADGVEIVIDNPSKYFKWKDIEEKVK